MLYTYTLDTLSRHSRQLYGCLLCLLSVSSVQKTICVSMYVCIADWIGMDDNSTLARPHVKAHPYVGNNTKMIADRLNVNIYLALQCFKACNLL